MVDERCNAAMENTDINFKIYTTIYNQIQCIYDEVPDLAGPTPSLIFRFLIKLFYNIILIVFICPIFINFVSMYKLIKIICFLPNMSKVGRLAGEYYNFWQEQLRCLGNRRRIFGFIQSIHVWWLNFSWLLYRIAHSIWLILCSVKESWRNYVVVVK
jgi:hypothetical protein